MALNRTWLYTSLILATLLLGAHLAALDTYAYWHYWWLDIPMHIFGGATIGAFLLALGQRRPWLYIGLMAGVVIGWEVFEYLGDISTGQPNYWSDTIGDMINGIIGSGITYGIYRKSSWR